MSEDALRSVLARIRASTDAAPPSSRADTRLLIVEPLLAALGWDVRSDATDRDVVVDGTRLEYVCSVDATPGLFVAVEPYGESLDRDRASALEGLMRRTRVDRVIYTNGRKLALLAGTDAVERTALDLSAPLDRWAAVDDFSRPAVARRLDDHAYERAARRLALARSDLAAAVTEELASAAGAVHEDELATMTDRFLDRVVESFTLAAAARSADASAETPTADADDGPATADADDASGTDDAGDAADAADTADDADATTAGDPETATPDAASRSDAGYVVRFFAEQGSVGAIGHATSDDALVHAAEFCLDHGLSRVEIPWTPRDGDRVVLNDEPVGADGTPMAEPRQLSNGLYIETAGTVEERATRVERIVSRAGLRAMLTGGWSGGVR
ncbi:hypothetical protein [Salinilacihabitans rarus]|uniref:hypothetical protein n=1 Tax=Salinilacihabitans rarus TaxID=2961596 RepID=UPI0020C88926|nr:hypothetical protein [Salinilacihabitans rarus]